MRASFKAKVCDLYHILQLADGSWGRDSTLLLLLLLLLSRFSRVRLCATPEKTAHQAPLSLGFSRKNTGVDCHFLLQETLCWRLRKLRRPGRGEGVGMEWAGMKCEEGKGHGFEEQSALLGSLDFTPRAIGDYCLGGVSVSCLAYVT